MTERLGTRGRATSREVGLFALALVVGSVLAALAPEPWNAGPGRVILGYRGEIIIDSRADIGAESPLELTAIANETEFELVLPGGIPVEGAVHALLKMNGTPGGTRPQVEDFSLSIALPGGEEERIPIIGWNEELQALEASRRPPQGSAVVLGLLGFVVVLWVTEAVPLFVTSLLIPVILVFTGVAAAGEALSPFFNPIIVLFFAGFLMAEAMKRSELDRYVAVGITARAGKRPVTLYAAMIGVTAVMSMFMSNTAAAAVLVPIAIAVSAPIAHEGFRRALVLGIAYAATVGGVGSAIGTPANQLAIEFLGSFGGRQISFVEWFAFGLPMVAVFLPVMALYLWRTSDVRVDSQSFQSASAVAERHGRRLGRLRGDQMMVLAVFIAVAVGWLTQTWHGIHAGIVALAGAVVLFIIRRLEPGDLARISWTSLLTFGGGLTLGLFIVDSGTSDYLATRLVGLADIPTPLALLAVASITLLLTTVASNTASAAILIPLAIPLAGVLGLSPALLVVLVAIASSVDFALVIGTPPTMIAYATRMYTAGQIFRKGIILDAIGILLLVYVVAGMWDLMGLV